MASAGTDTIDFYPRSPRGERRGHLLELRHILDISIHAPREGSDLAAGKYMTGLANISIHAPREGSDPDCSSPDGKHGLFLSTLPARGATKKLEYEHLEREISIHAPREGSDGMGRPP